MIAHQRQRIFDAIAGVTGRTGYARLSTEEILAAAQLSRRTFYEHFPNREAAFAATYAHARDELLGRCDAADSPDEPLATRAERMLTAVVAYAQECPAFADLAIVHALAAPPEIVADHQRVLEALIANVHVCACGAIPARDRPPEMSTETMVHGVYGVLSSRMREGRHAELQLAVPDLLYTVLLPYVDQSTARAARTSAKRRITRRLAAAARQA